MLLCFIVLDYFSTWWMIPVLIWTITWKAIAAWKAARKGDKGWFVVIFVLNTFSIVPIIYILLTKRQEAMKPKPKKKSTSKKKIVKKK